MSVGVEMTDR